MKNQIIVILSFLSLFVVLSSQAEAAVTNGEVQYYYESSTATSSSSTSETQESSTTSDSLTSSTMKEVTSHKNTPASMNNRDDSSRSGITRFLQTNDQRNTFLVVIGLLILAIAFLGWRISKNRRKNE
ncbi:LPXTG cell wall anchor domain-containing protein [Enterococcus sp. AZ196]|uniref:LPXTG cell wall anchor domain-containing protein n=1 Tax=Enterococcus sp. AZ196 TaxID=2774659 RepID=UPI003D27F190